MIKRRNKALSIIMSLCLCFALLAPIFVAPDAAQASCTYKVMSAPTVVTGNVTKDLGVVKVTLDDTAIATGSIVTVSMPSDLRFGANGDLRNAPAPNPAICGTVNVAANAPAANGPITVVAGGTGDALGVAAFNGPFNITPNNTFDIKLVANAATLAGANGGSNKYFYIYFNGIDLNNYNNDIKVNFLPPSGSAFSMAQDLVIGKSTSTGGTLTTCKKVVDVTDAGGKLDIITVHEQSPDTFKMGNQIKLEILTNGFKFKPSGFTGALTGGLVSYGWDFTPLGNNPLNVNAAAGTIASCSLGSNDKLLTYNVFGSTTGPTGVELYNNAGKISFTNLPIEVDDTKAKAGDVCEIKVSGDNVTSTTIQVATFVSYGVTVEAGTAKELIAGQDGQEIGDFTIKEGAPASLLVNRIVTLTLPDGCEWDRVGTGSSENTASGSVTFNADNAYPALDTNNRILKWKVGTASTSAAKVKFKEFKIDVSPKFTGDVEVAVSGSAGAEGKVKVATVKPAATISVAKVANVELGKANQKIDDIIITEGAVGAILDSTSTPVGGTARANAITLELDDGYRFAKVPTVAVTEGNMSIDSKSVNTQDSGSQLTFKIDSKSSKTAAKIKISDVVIDAYRTAPEGAINLKFVDGRSALNECLNAAGTTVSFANDSPGKAVIANCVTPSMKEGTTGAAVGQFKVSSNIYEVNGVSKVMDAAPYIKNGRTYVPVKYLGLALGVAEADIVWDQAAQKATLTLGDKKVELTIGSTNYTVNGEAKTMDVAPEINSGRTMLPARYVAEALGYNVGWDAATGTVLVSK